MNVRVGLFFLLVGFLAMFVFYASYKNQTPSYTLLLAGLGSIILGAYLMIKNRPASGGSERFRSIRKLGKKK